MNRRLSRRSFLATVGAGSLTALAGCNSTGPSVEPPEEPPSGPIANATIPTNASDYPYAVAGTPSSDTVPIVYFGNWKCPYCAQFSSGSLSNIITDYVEPGDAAIQFRALSYFNDQPFLGPDAPRAARAGLAVWNLAPEKYWSFHEAVFANQPPENERWATVENLVSFAESAGVTQLNALRNAIKNGKYSDEVHKTTDAASNLDVDSTPVLAINNETTVNALNTSEVRERLDNATQ